MSLLLYNWACCINNSKHCHLYRKNSTFEKEFEATVQLNEKLKRAEQDDGVGQKKFKLLFIYNNNSNIQKLVFFSFHFVFLFFCKTKEMVQNMIYQKKNRGH